MTVYNFLKILIRNIGSVDIGDTQFIIRTLEGDYETYSLYLDDDIDGQVGLVLDVLGNE